jgi:hypothetical protein
MVAIEYEMCLVQTEMCCVCKCFEVLIWKENVAGHEKLSLRPVWATWWDPVLKQSK